MKDIYPSLRPAQPVKINYRPDKLFLKITMLSLEELSWFLLQFSVHFQEEVKHLF